MAATVKELIEELKKLPPNAQVILQKDGEGNGFSPLSGVSGSCIYVPESSWHGEVYDTNWSASDACMSDEDWTEFCKQEKCVILEPTN